MPVCILACRWVCVCSVNIAQHYEIVITMCITAHVVKLLLALYLPVFLFLSLEIFVHYFARVIHLSFLTFMLPVSASKRWGDGQHTVSQKWSCTGLLCFFFILILVRARKTLLQIQWFCSTWYLKYHYYNYSRFDRAARNTHRNSTQSVKSASYSPII